MENKWTPDEVIDWSEEARHRIEGKYLKSVEEDKIEYFKSMSQLAELAVLPNRNTRNDLIGANE